MKYFKDYEGDFWVFTDNLDTLVKRFELDSGSWETIDVNQPSNFKETRGFWTFEEISKDDVFLEMV